MSGRGQQQVFVYSAETVARATWLARLAVAEINRRGWIVRSVAVSTEPGGYRPRALITILYDGEEVDFTALPERPFHPGGVA